MKLRILSGMSVLMVLVAAVVPLGLSDQISHTDPQDMPKPQIDIKDVTVYNDEANFHFEISVYASEIELTPKKCGIWVVSPVSRSMWVKIMEDGSIKKFFDGQLTIEGNTYEFIVPREFLGNAAYIDFHVKSWDPDWIDIGRDHVPDSGYLTYHWQVPSILGVVDVDPDTLNLQSKGRWITCYIEFPEDYDVGEIDIGTIELNEQVPAESRPSELGDYDGDGIPDLMVKFNGSVVQEILEVGNEVEITVSGELTDGTPFEGSDTIRVIDKGGKK